jgi:predicted glycosyltransferase
MKHTSRAKSGDEKPAVIVWVESSHTPSHLERTSGIVKGLVNEGVHVMLIAGHSMFEAAIANGGDLQHFGIPKSVEIVSLPTTNENMNVVPKDKEHPEYAMWQYMNDPAVTAARRKMISEAVLGLEKRGYKPTHLVAEMWPTGFGMFTDEIGHLKRVMNSLNRGAKLYPVVRDIPFF